MRKLVALLGSLALVVGFATPAATATKYAAVQKTLSPFSSSATSLTSTQRAEVRRVVEANPDAEKFICTGIRYFSQPMSENIKVRARAKAACEYAKQLNPELSTWFQNKPTKARSYAGKVLLTIRIPAQPGADEQDATATLLNDYACDTDKQQPLTLRENHRWPVFRYTCQSDKQKAAEPLAPMALAGDATPCQLEDKSPPRLNSRGRGVPDEDYIVGFPRTTSPYRLEDRELKVLFIPVDFVDYKDNVDPRSFAVPAAKMMDDFYKTYTRGAVSFDWHFHDQWITIDQSIKNFTQSESTAMEQWGEENTSVVDRFWNAAIEATDPIIDYTNADLVFIVLPRDQDASKEFNLWPPFSNSYETDEGKIMRGFVPGSYQFRPDKDLWAFWAHETLHYFRLPDLYWHDQNSVRATELTYHGAFQGYDIMTNQDGVSKALSTWLMWLAGWLQDSEVACITKETFSPGSIEISPTHIDDEKLKSIMIRMSDTEAIVVESRRSTQFDVVDKENRSREGVIVYALDTTIQNGSGVATLLAPAGRKLISLRTKAGANTVNLDGVLYEGNSISVGGYLIEVSKSELNSDTISISRDENWTTGDDPTYVCFTKENRDMSPPYKFSCPIRY